MYSGYVNVTGGDVTVKPVREDRKVIIDFLKDMAGMEKYAPNYAVADFYDEKGLPQIARYVRNKK